MGSPTDIDEDEDQPFDPSALTPGPELPPSSSPPQWLTPADGEVWGDYRLGEMLGQGGMGMVFKAHQLSLNRAVALKVLTPYLGTSESFRARFLREAQSVARIASPHVVQVYAAGAHRDFQYFAMEFVDGEDLGGKLARGYRPSRAETLDIITQAARGLVAAGEHDIVHRDIKPGNMMITRKGVVKLMDFGLVRIASEERMTTTGVVMGTPYYFSPEQARGEDCDQRADLYSLGIVFYELLTGELPFTGDANAVVYAHINTRPRRPRDLDGEIPAEWQEVVLTCLAKKPEARYRSAAELLRDLERLAADQAPALVRPARSPWPIRAAAAAVAVIAATVSGYALGPGAPARTAAGALPTSIGPAAPAAPAPSSAVAAIAPEPTVPSEIPPIAVPCERAATVRAPFVGGRFVSYRWTLEGPVGASGRIDAEATVVGENTWTAPGRSNASATLRVIGTTVAGREYSATLRLGSTTADFTNLRPQPFARWPTMLPTATRPARDALGRWWACDSSVRRLWLVSADWLRQDAIDYVDEGAYEPPRALAARGDGGVIALLARRALRFDEHGALARRLALDGDTSDLVGIGDRLLLADRGQDLRALNDAGEPAGRKGPACARLAALRDGGAMALAADGKRVLRLDAQLRQLGELPIPLRGGEQAADIALHAEGALVLLSSGAVAVFDPTDAAAPPRRIEPSLPVEPRGRPGAITVGAAGEALVTWPLDGMVSRLPLGGWTAAARGGPAGRADACAADARGRLWRLADDAALLGDAQGWCVARVDSKITSLAKPEQIAVSPDGARLALAGARSVVLVDLEQSPPVARAVPARDGRWPGSPRLALDEHHRLYVLDRDAGRVTVVEEDGVSSSFTCEGVSKPALLAVSPGGAAVYVASGDGATLGKYLFDHDHATIDPAKPIAFADLGGHRADAIGCDLQGQLYVLDDGQRLRVCTWKFGPATLVANISLPSVGLPEAHTLAVSPDGQAWLGSGDCLAGLRW